MLNPEGLSFGVRGIPETDVDLNRLYPGKADGTASERLTAKIWEVAKKHDVIIDLHTMGVGLPMILINSCLIVEGNVYGFQDTIIYRNNAAVGIVGE